MDKFDFYQKANEIGSLLSLMGLDEWKRRIDDAITQGAMAGEILMALRWTLQELQKSSVKLSETLRVEIDDFIKHVDHVYPTRL